MRAVEPTGSLGTHQGRHLANRDLTEGARLRRPQSLERQLAAVGDGGAWFDPDTAIDIDTKNPI
jgi:hypothetical protein